MIPKLSLGCECLLFLSRGREPQAGSAWGNSWPLSLPQGPASLPAPMRPQVPRLAPILCALNLAGSAQDCKGPWQGAVCSLLGMSVSPAPWRRVQRGSLPGRGSAAHPAPTCQSRLWHPPEQEQDSHEMIPLLCVCDKSTGEKPMLCWLQSRKVQCLARERTFGT